MRRFVPGSLRRSRINIEELECRAQPALFGLGVSVHTLDTPAALHASAFVGLTLPTNANEHAQVAVALHSHVGNPPTDPPGDGGGGGGTGGDNGGVGGGIGSGGGNGGNRGNNGGNGGGGVTNPPPVNDPPASDPGQIVTPDVFSPSTVSVSFVFVRETTTPVFVGTPASVASSAFASSGLLLPPERTADATTALATATDSTAAAATSPALAPAGVGRFPGAASIPYLSAESPVAVAAFEAGSRAATKTEAATENTWPGATTPVKAAHRLDRATDAPADQVVLVPFLVPAMNPDAFAAPAADVVPVAAPIAVEEGSATWTWAVGVIGVAAGAAWAVRRYWLKPAPAKQPDPRAWQRYLLGADFDRT